MAYINVAEWTSENVAEWLGGLDDAILPYAHFFINNQIDGRHLLTLLPDDLKNLNIVKIGHQEIILDAVDLLRQLHYTLTTETLQSIALRVGCKARSLYNELKRNGPKECPENKGAKQERVSCNILASVSDILIAVKAFISWLDRYPFDGEARYIPVRKSLLTLSIELASTAQRDQFAERPHDIIKNSALNLAELCDQIIQDFNDSLIIQPAALDIITVKRKPKEEWGIHIHSTYNGVHIVGGVKHQSPAHRCAKVEIGDEIIQVNYQTVVGWQLKKLVYSMSEHATDVHLTLKKRPRHSNLSGQVIVMKPYRIPCRKTALARLHKWSESNCSLNIQEGGYVSSNSSKAPIATDEVEDEDDSAFLPDKSAISLAVPPSKVATHPNGNCAIEKVTSSFQPKSRATVQRRATVSGASPVQTRAPVSIEELVGSNTKSPSTNQKDLVARSISHDPRKHSMGSGTMTQPSLSFLKHLSSLQAADETEELNQSNDSVQSSRSQPIDIGPSVSRQRNAATHEGSGMSASGSDGDSGIAEEKASTCSSNFPIWKPISTPKPIITMSKPTFDDDFDISKVSLQQHSDGAQLHLKKLMEQIASPSSTPPPSSPVRKQSSSSSIASSTVSDNVFIGGKNSECDEKSKLIEGDNVKANTYTSKEKKCAFQSPLLRKKHHFHGRYASRRVSCKDLGQGDCQGWLFKRKDGKRLFSGPKWSKKWVVLKKQYLYCYQDKDDVRAECLVFLPGFVVSPATECKAKKYAFKLHSPSASFLFASDCVSDMTKWMNKMGLAAISYPSLTNVIGEAGEVYFSETEDESEDGSPSRVIITNSQQQQDSESKSKLNQGKVSGNVVATQKSSPMTTYVEKNDSGRYNNTSPKSPPTFSGKISFPKPSASPLSVSPRKTVAEKPLEKSYPEQDVYRRSSSSTRNSVYPSKNSTSNRHSGSWNVLEQTDNVSNQRSPGFASTNVETMSSQHRNSQTFKTNSPVISPNRGPPPPPMLPARATKSPIIPSNSIANVSHQSPLSAWKGTSRSTPAVSAMLRCSSLQKLNSSETWPVETKDESSNHAQSLQRQKEFVSVLDREYRRLYGDKKPETISPKHSGDDDGHYNSLDSSGRSPNTWWGNQSNVNIVRSATSQQIHSLYTRDCWKDNEGHCPHPSEEKSRSVSVSCETGGGVENIAPPLPERNSGAKFFLSGVNSIGRGNSKKMSGADAAEVFSYSPQTSSLSSSPNLTAKNNKSCVSISSKSSSASKFSLSKQFSPKSPGTSAASSSFRFFSSPKFVRKFTSPKPERKRLTSTATVTSPTIALGHLNGANPMMDLKIKPGGYNYEGAKQISSPSPSPSMTSSVSKSQKSERTFLGSPKLARAIFGSPKQVKKSVAAAASIGNSTTTTTAVQTDHSFDELVRLHQQSLYGNVSNQGSPNLRSLTSINDRASPSITQRSGSSSSINSNLSGHAMSSTGNSHFYVEARIRPQITISLPLVTESGQARPRFVGNEEELCDLPETPKTPGALSKPTMGVSMLAKKRSPSASSDVIQSDGRTSRQNATDQHDNNESESTLTDLSFEEQVEYDRRSELAEEEMQRSQRSSITVIINENPPKKIESVTMTTREKDELEELMKSFKELGLSPDGINIEERRRRLLSLLGKDDDMDEKDRITRLVLDFRALQRTLKDHEVEAAAIEELLSGPITSETLENWICQYPHLLPPDYC